MNFLRKCCLENFILFSKLHIFCESFVTIRQVLQSFQYFLIFLSKTHNSFIKLRLEIPHIILRLFWKFFLPFFGTINIFWKSLLKVFFLIKFYIFLQAVTFLHTILNFLQLIYIFFLKARTFCNNSSDNFFLTISTKLFIISKKNSKNHNSFVKLRLVILNILRELFWNSLYLFLELRIVWYHKVFLKRQANFFRNPAHFMTSFLKAQ